MFYSNNARIKGDLKQGIQDVFSSSSPTELRHLMNVLEATRVCEPSKPCPATSLYISSNNINWTTLSYNG
jgi:hypothetical protein